MDVDGASALVTGGAGGLGAATVRRLASCGAGVVIADLAEDAGQLLAKDLGERVQFVRTDVTDEASMQGAVDMASELGPLRVAVTAHGGPVASSRIVGRSKQPYGLDVFRRTIDIYLVGTFNALRLSAARMADSPALDSGQRGVVVNTSSIAAFEGQVGQSDYAAAKAGVVGLCLVAARDLAPLGIRVMTIAPGTFFTPAFQMSEEDAQARWGSAIPNPQRMGRPEEYAHLVQAIIENDYLNGDVVRLDGAHRFPPR